MVLDFGQFSTQRLNSFFALFQSLTHLHNLLLDLCLRSQYNLQCLVLFILNCNITRFITLVFNYYNNVLLPLRIMQNTTLTVSFVLVCAQGNGFLYTEKLLHEG